jgi:hypothetical protein
MQGPTAVGTTCLGPSWPVLVQAWVPGSAPENCHLFWYYPGGIGAASPWRYWCQIMHCFCGNQFFSTMPKPLAKFLSRSASRRGPPHLTTTTNRPAGSKQRTLRAALKEWRGLICYFLSPALCPPHMPQSPGVITWAHGWAWDPWSWNRQNHPERPLWPREIISPRPRDRAPVGALPPSPEQRDKPARQHL